MKRILDHIGSRFSIYFLVMLIGVLLMYYVLDYVPSNKRKLDDHAIRILESKANTIEDKYQGYSQSLKNAPISYFANWYFNVHKDKHEIFVGKFLPATSKEKLIEYPKIDYSEIQGDKSESITPNDIKFRSRVDKDLVPVEMKPWEALPLMTIWRDESGSGHFIFDMPFHFSNRNPKPKKSQPEPHDEKPYFFVNIDSFTYNLKSNDFFEDIVLIRARYKKKGATYTKKDGIVDVETAGLDYHILDHSLLDLPRLELPDSINKNGAGFFNENIRGQKYRVYYKLIKLRKGLDVFLVGLVNHEEFHSESLKVPHWFVIFSSLGALVLIFIFPVLKLFLLNENERLSTGDISLAVFSVVICTCFIFLFIMGNYFYWGIEKERADDGGKYLALKVRKEVKSEKDSLASYVNRMVNRVRKIKQKQKPSDPEISTSTIILPKGDFLNDVFTIDSTGFISTLFASKSPLDVEKFPLSLHSRTYFKSAYKHPSDTILQAINSYTEGISEVALSMYNPDSKEVRVITSSFPALIKAKMPSPYKFVVLDQENLVKFHSDWSEIKTENFSKEAEDNDNLPIYIRKGISDFIDFNYLRKPCRGFHTPLTNSWTLLVYYEESHIRDLAAQSYMMSLISLAALVLYLTILHFIIRSQHRKMVLLHTKPFLFDWLNPHYHSAKSWRVLAGLNFFLVLILFGSIYILNSFITQLLVVFFIVTLCYLVNYSSLNGKDKVTRTLLGIFCFTWFGLAVYNIGDSNKFRDGYFIAGAITVFAFCVIATFYTPVTPMAEIKNEGIGKKYLAYKFFLLAWLMVIALAPTCGFLYHHYRYELLIRSFSYMLEDAVKLKNEPGMCYRTTDSAHLLLLVVDDSLPHVSKMNATDVEYYYKLFPRFAVSDKQFDGLKFNYFPSLEKWDMRGNDTLLRVVQRYVERNNGQEKTPEFLLLSEKIKTTRLIKAEENPLKEIVYAESISDRDTIVKKDSIAEIIPGYNSSQDKSVGEKAPPIIIKSESLAAKKSEKDKQKSTLAGSTKKETFSEKKEQILRPEIFSKAFLSDNKSNDNKIRFSSVLEGFQLNPNEALLISFILFGIFIYLLWWILDEMPRRIYYIPGHFAWDAYGPTHAKWGSPDLEYENYDKELHPLKGLEKKLGESKSEDEAVKYEEQIVNLQQEFQNRYDYRWASCSDEEKFMLYDLADDGVANQINKRAMSGLAQKGLIRLYPRFEIVNVSLANFVREVMKKEEIEKLERTEKSEGRWSHIRVFLIIIIISAFAFLTVAEEGFLGRTTALIGSLMLVAPNVIGLFGTLARMFGKNPI